MLELPNLTFFAKQDFVKHLNLFRSDVIDLGFDNLILKILKVEDLLDAWVNLVIHFKHPFNFLSSERALFGHGDISQLSRRLF